jgi:hypothetical protein
LKSRKQLTIDIVDYNDKKEESAEEEDTVLDEDTKVNST